MDFDEKQLKDLRSYRIKTVLLLLLLFFFYQKKSFLSGLIASECSGACCITAPLYNINFLRAILPLGACGWSFISGFVYLRICFIYKFVSSEDETDNAMCWPFAAIELLLAHPFHNHQRNLKLFIEKNIVSYLKKSWSLVSWGVVHSLACASD